MTQVVLHRRAVRYPVHGRPAHIERYRLRDVPSSALLCSTYTRRRSRRAYHLQLLLLPPPRRNLTRMRSRVVVESAERSPDGCAEEAEGRLTGPSLLKLLLLLLLRLRLRLRLLLLLLLLLFHCSVVVVAVVGAVVVVVVGLVRASGGWAQSVGLRPPWRSHLGCARRSLGHAGGRRREQ